MTIDLDWETFAEFLIGRCRMRMRDAMRVSVYEFRHMRNAADKEDQLLWDVARWSVFHLVWAIPGKHTGTPRSVAGMFPMSWDKKKTGPVDCVVTEAEHNALMDIYRAFQARKKHNE